MMDKIIKWNNDQREHERIVQRQVHEFCTKIMDSAIEHDNSKWSEKEYRGFLDSFDSLKQSKTGTDEEYQKQLKSEAIQHHITENPHHAEYWDKREKRMPVHEVISMFFDWRSRSLMKGESMDGFWKYNLEKLRYQPHARVIVEALKEEYEQT